MAFDDQPAGGSADEQRRRVLMDLVHTAQVAAAQAQVLAGAAMSGLLMPEALLTLPKAISDASIAGEQLDQAIARAVAHFREAGSC